MSEKNKAVQILDEIKASIEARFAELEHRIKNLLHPTSHEGVVGQLAATKGDLLTHVTAARDSLNGVDSTVEPVLTNDAAAGAGLVGAMTSNPADGPNATPKAAAGAAESDAKDAPDTKDAPSDTKGA